MKKLKQLMMTAAILAVSATAALSANIAVVGGLLTLAAWGPGDWSLDARRDRA